MDEEEEEECFRITRVQISSRFSYWKYTNGREKIRLTVIILVDRSQNNR